MLDGWARRRVDPVLGRLGHWAAGQGWQADQVTLAGLALGLAASGVIALGGAGAAALCLFLLGRVADGLDGTLARAQGQQSPFGGYLDIFCDFILYGAFPLAFALRDPADALAAAFLLFAFYVNAASFLGFAVLAEQRGMQTRARGEKSLYFSAGLMEGSETILAFALMCLWPAQFAPIALVFGVLCLITALARLFVAARNRQAGGRP